MGAPAAPGSRRLEHALGQAYYRSWADQFVVLDLGSRTAQEALDDGVPPKEVWGAVWAALELPAGSTVLLYTDGVVERRHADLDEGLAQLRAASAGLLGDGDPGRLCRGVVSAASRQGRTDDAAAVAVTLCRP